MEFLTRLVGSKMIPWSLEEMGSSCRMNSALFIVDLCLPLIPSTDWKSHSSSPLQELLLANRQGLAWAMQC